VATWAIRQRPSSPDVYGCMRIYGDSGTRVGVVPLRAGPRSALIGVGAQVSTSSGRASIRAVNPRWTRGERFAAAEPFWSPLSRVNGYRRRRGPRGRRLPCGVTCPPVNSGVQASSAAAHLLASSSVFIVRARHSRTAAYQTRWTGNPSRWGESAGVPVVAVRHREPVS
jgi:hypothetical protein